MSSLDKLAREAMVDDTFMSMLKRFIERGQNVSDTPKSTKYGPTQFAEAAAAKEHRIKRAEMVDAMNRLLDAGKIKVEDYGKPSNRHSRIVPT